MTEKISSKKLFGSGAAKLFHSIGNDNELDQKSIQFLDKGKFIRQVHSAGNPNHSFDSTASGAIEGASRLVSGFTNSTVEQENFFGENIRESIKIVRNFFSNK